MPRPALYTPAERADRRRVSLKLSAQKQNRQRVLDRAAKRAQGRATPLAHASKWDVAQFIAIDGEGLTTRGRHRYVLLCASTGDTLTRPKGISTVECLEFLVALSERHPKAILVGFGLSYDVNMMLGDLTIRQVRKVWAGQTVRYKGFTIECRMRKSLKVRRYPAIWGEDSKGRLVCETGPAMWWDTFGFFQGSFVSALDKYLGADYHLLAFIAEQKQRRSRFTTRDLPLITRYCQAECVALVDLMHRLRSYLGEADLKIARWDGAGAVAAALLARQGVRHHLSKACPAETPRAVALAAQHAYAGGRMEVLRYGHAPHTPIYHYDINSAYPAALRDLPSLGLGRWAQEVDHRILRHYAQTGSTDFAMYHVRFNFTRGQTLYPFFWRAPHGAIFFPPEGEGWYWSPEVNAAVEALNRGALKGNLEIVDSWRWECLDSDKPFGWIDPLYRQRQEWKAANVGAEKVVKLALNSLYGKMAQHLGGTSDKAPAFHQLEWAGWITSATRAKLYVESVGRPGIIMLATDALYSTDKLDLPVGLGLGEWAAHTHSGLTVVQSGLYWTDDKGASEVFCRGWDKGTLNRARIVRAWAHGQRETTAYLTRFVGMGSALAGPEQWARWRTWRTARRMLALTMAGTKRHETSRKNPAKGLVPTGASEYEGRFFEPMSAPYPLPWERGEWGTIDGVPEAEALREAGDGDI